MERTGKTPPPFTTTLGAMHPGPLRAPWSNQSVSLVVRVGAAFFVLCGLVALGAATYFTIIEGIQVDQLLFVLSAYISIAYMIWLFGYVVLHGKAPAGWLPSRSKG